MRVPRTMPSRASAHDGRAVAISAAAIMNGKAVDEERGRAVGALRISEVAFKDRDIEGQLVALELR